MSCSSDTGNVNVKNYMLRSFRFLSAASPSTRPLAANLIDSANQWISSDSTDTVALFSILTELRNSSRFTPSDKSFTAVMNQLARDPRLQTNLPRLLRHAAHLRYPATGFLLLPILTPLIPSLNPSDLAGVAWASAKLELKNDTLYDQISHRFLSLEYTPGDLDVFLNALALADHVLSQLQADQCKRSIVEFCKSNTFTDRDLRGYFCSACRLWPKDGEFLKGLSETLVRLFGVKADSATVPGANLTAILPESQIMSLWAALARAYRSEGYLHVSDSFLDMLYEQTRTLRLGHGLDESAFIELLKSVVILRCKDPRVLFQLVCYVSTKGQRLRKEQYRQTVIAFAKLRIEGDEAWRRLAGRFEKHAPSFSLKEIREIERCFKMAKKFSPRLEGVMQLFVSLKEDMEFYGPS